jgi:hypothetical protein
MMLTALGSLLELAVTYYGGCQWGAYVSRELREVSIRINGYLVR